MNSISKSDVTQLLLTGVCEPEEADYLELNGIKLDMRVLPSLGRRISLLGDLKTFFEIRKWAKVFEPEIVHTHTFKAGFLGRLAVLSLRTRPALVHTFHGHLLNGYYTGFKLFVLKTIERYLAKRTSYLVAVGKKVMLELIQEGIGSRNKYIVIPPGFPMRQIWTSTNTSVRSDLNEFRCAWVGRLVEIKAPHRILEIARIIRNSNTKIKFIVAGDGHLRENIQLQSECEGLPIEFLGWTKNVEEVLAKSDLLLLTSINEGTPVSIIEAQRMGKPVISTNVGSIEEVISINRSGYAISYDPEKFAELIEEFALNEDLLRDFSEEAIRFSKEKFTPERLANDYLQIYRTLILRTEIDGKSSK
jgi:glycosyltransferase involved in cell wall biosynthesis